MLGISDTRKERCRGHSQPRFSGKLDSTHPLYTLVAQQSIALHFVIFGVGHFHYTVRLFLGGHEAEVFLQIFNYDFMIFENLIWTTRKNYLLFKSLSIPLLGCTKNPFVTKQVHIKHCRLILCGFFFWFVSASFSFPSKQNSHNFVPNIAYVLFFNT